MSLFQALTDRDEAQKQIDTLVNKFYVYLFNNHRQLLKTIALVRSKKHIRVEYLTVGSVRFDPRNSWRLQISIIDPDEESNESLIILSEIPFAAVENIGGEEYWQYLTQLTHMYQKLRSDDLALELRHKQREVEYAQADLKSLSAWDIVALEKLREHLAIVDSDPGTIASIFGGKN